MEKQSLHRFTTGILTQQETEQKSKIVKQKGKRAGGGCLGTTDDGRKERKREEK